MLKGSDRSIRLSSEELRWDSMLGSPMTLLRSKKGINRTDLFSRCCQLLNRVEHSKNLKNPIRIDPSIIWKNQTRNRRKVQRKKWKRDQLLINRKRKFEVFKPFKRKKILISTSKSRASMSRKSPRRACSIFLSLIHLLTNWTISKSSRQRRRLEMKTKRSTLIWTIHLRFRNILHLTKLDSWSWKAWKT